MDLSTINKISLLQVALEKTDSFSAEFGSQIKNIVNGHKQNNSEPDIDVFVHAMNLETSNQHSHCTALLCQG